MRAPPSSFFFTSSGYDDFWTTVNPLDVGEGKAHQEMAIKYGLRFRCVGGPCRPPPTTSACHPNNHFAPIFLLIATGVPAGSEEHGFEFAREDLTRWMNASRACQSVQGMRR